MQIFSNAQIPEHTRKTVNNMAALKRLPQCVMLTGGSDALREKCAYELAAAAMCEDKNAPCGKCSSCRKALKGLHPDITVVRPTEKRKLVSIDDVREGVIEKLYVTPNEADAKVFILTGASDYSVYVQNALLKSVEEPPEDSMFIFECNQRNDMLPTIVSRAVELHLGQIQKKSGKSTKKDELAFSLAKALAEYNEFALVEATSAIGKDRDLFSGAIDRLTVIIRDALASGSGADMLSGLEDGTIEKLAGAYGVSELIGIKKLLDDVGHRVEVNGNLALTGALMASEAGLIMRAARK